MSSATHFIPAPHERQEQAIAAAARVRPRVRAWIGGMRMTAAGRLCNEWEIEPTLAATAEWDGVRICARLHTTYGWPVDMELAAILHAFSIEWKALEAAELARRVEAAAEAGRKAKAAAEAACA